MDGFSPLARGAVEGRTLDMVERLDLCQTRAEVSALFHNYVTDLGFSHATCIKVPEVGDEDADCVLLTTAPDAWMRHYLAAGYMRRDPVVRELSRSLQYQPYSWADVRGRRIFAADDELIFADAAEFGFFDGFCVPVVEAGGYTGLVNLPAHTMRLPRDARTPVKYACLSLHLKLSLLRRRTADEIYDLTERELECVRWAAAGKSDWEIGQILNISAKTVNYHIENTKRKFGVATRVQAIVSALRSGKLVK
jgi:LuxR family transcriptional regulator, quorum-sensing system regulator BjaR1